MGQQYVTDKTVEVVVMACDSMHTASNLGIGIEAMVVVLIHWRLHSWGDRSTAGSAACETVRPAWRK